MNLIYDRWRVSAITHREKILTDFRKKYQYYKKFIPDLKVSSLTKQHEILKPFFRDYDSLRPDEGTFESVDDFLSRPFFFLSVYEKIKIYEMLKKEFPYAWLKHYNTWEKREAAYLRMQGSLSGINIVNNLSSIAGFDFFSGADLKSYERMPSDFAYLNIQNAMISSKITLTITRIKSCLMTGMPINYKRLSFPLKEAVLFPQLEEICRSNHEFSMKETLFSHIRLPELVYIDGISLMKKYPACKEGELPRILYQDLISEDRQVHIAVSQFVPSVNRYKVKLMLLELTDILEDPYIKNLAPIKQKQTAQAVEKKNLKDLLGGQDKMAVEFELARKMEMARNDYEAFYQKHFKYEGQNQLKNRMEIFRKAIAPEPYFLAMEEFFKKPEEEFCAITNPYSLHSLPSVSDIEKLYLFFINEYGKLDRDSSVKAVNALLLGNQSQYFPVLKKLIQDINSTPIEDYAFFSPPQLFENLNRYFPLYHKTILAERLIGFFPDFSAELQKNVRFAAEMSWRFCFCRTFYSYACKLSKVFGFSFDTAKSLPHGMELTYDSMIQDEVFGYFQNWLAGRIHFTASDGTSEEPVGFETSIPSIYAGYSFPLCLSELDLSRLLEIVNAHISWTGMEKMMPAFYFDGTPVKQLSEITDSISGGRHTLDLPYLYPDLKGKFHVTFLRIYERTGVLPNDSARKKHSRESAMQTGKLLSEEFNSRLKEYLEEQADSITKKQEKVEKQHLASLKRFEEDMAKSGKIREQIEQEERNLAQKREELKKLRTLPPPAKLSAGKRFLGKTGMFKKSVKRYQDEVTERREQLSKMEKQVTEAKNSISSYLKQLEISNHAKEVVGIYKQLSGK